MAIFGNKRPKAVECGLCGTVYTPGEGRPHDTDSHIVKISLTEPSWLPANLRAVAQGEYTFRCDRCNSFPSIKWPSKSGASAGVLVHLAVAHNAGVLSHTAGTAIARSPNCDMIPVRPHPESSPWVPTVEMSTARPVVFALANAPASNNAQVRAAIARFVRLSDRPRPEQAILMVRNEPDVLNRPWMWLAALMRHAGNSGDLHLAAAGLYWACYWTGVLVPKIGNDAATFAELELDPIPHAVKKEILALGVSSASQLPVDFVIVGDETAQIDAGFLLDKAHLLLGL